MRKLEIELNFKRIEDCTRLAGELKSFREMMELIKKYPLTGKYHIKNPRTEWAMYDFN